VDNNSITDFLKTWMIWIKEWHIVVKVIGKIRVGVMGVLILDLKEVVIFMEVPIIYILKKRNVVNVNKNLTQIDSLDVFSVDHQHCYVPIGLMFVFDVTMVSGNLWWKPFPNLYIWEILDQRILQ